MSLLALGIVTLAICLFAPMRGPKQTSRKEATR